MTHVEDRARPMPLVTRIFQVGGAVAIALGVILVVGVALSSRELGGICEGFSCLSTALGVLLAVWGVLAMLAAIRGLAGLLFLIAAIVAPLAFSWIQPLAGLVYLVLLFPIVGASKERLAAYYRRSPPEVRA